MVALVRELQRLGALEARAVGRQAEAERGKVLELLAKVMRKQQYYFVTENFAVKVCRWTRSALLGGEPCYKCKFYGIESHRCLQMTPSAFWCWNACVHCWRVRAQDLGLSFNELAVPDYGEDVEEVVDALIEAQRKLLSGYWGNPKVDKKLLEEAMNPKHAAISLSGEPTLYGKLQELIKAFHRRGMTTFLVTRGVRPDVLRSLEEPPTQVYLSMESYTKEMYEWLNRPLVPRAWELTMETVKVLRDYKSPTVLRITLIKGVNDSESAARGFAKIVSAMQPTFIEVKGYVHVGASVYRLSRGNMPTHEDVKKFSRALSLATGYPIRSESKSSRVVLLSELEKPLRYGKGCPSGW